tara:strand:- start:340 stop:525 length:186 start_codon:yes stop_codon:yes gene_type:complete
VILCDESVNGSILQRYSEMRVFAGQLSRPCLANQGRKEQAILDLGYFGDGRVEADLSFSHI